MTDRKQEQRDTVRADDPANGPLTTDRGVVTDTSPGTAQPEFLRQFTRAVAEHRHWGRPPVRA
ncbi:hypothetical protein [Streptomyces longispororuber]|uniref:hypothetical protein n=1 Tax=Streptomyces longispororuber TaxID=68230 RepID=UPI00210A4669|nr:hypothetical protein [Streptomyces longispororuber]